MADLSYLKKMDKPLAVLGLGITGSAVAYACKNVGVDVHLWDDNKDKRTQFIKDGFTVFDFQLHLSNYGALIPAAGIKPSHPAVQEAISQNTPVQSDIDLLLQSAPEATYIGITGTNGKSTTTALISHILKTLNKNFVMGGNIGIGAAALPSLQSDGIYVLELSSYQLEITQLPICDIAVFLNIAPDHLAWHGTMENYIAAKEKIFRVKNNKQHSIVGTDTNEMKMIAQNLKENDQHDVVDLSMLTLPGGLDNIPTLKGAHNQQNIAAAYAVCQALKINDDDFVRAVKTFPGLIHRQQIVATINGVTFINDSKATNADATSKALSSFKNIHWIIGGEDKDDGLSGLDVFYPYIKHAYLIGSSSDRFAKDLNGHLKYTPCETLDNAVQDAFKNAKSGDVILLSPACASFDQYPNFEKRGEHFITLIEQIRKGQTS